MNGIMSAVHPNGDATRSGHLRVIYCYKDLYRAGSVNYGLSLSTSGAYCGTTSARCFKNRLTMSSGVQRGL